MKKIHAKSTEAVVGTICWLPISLLTSSDVGDDVFNYMILKSKIS